MTLYSWIFSQVGEDLTFLKAFFLLLMASLHVSLMVRGLRSPWKQPLAYYFACNTTPAAKLKELACDIVVKLKSVGLTVVV